MNLARQHAQAFRSLPSPGHSLTGSQARARFRFWRSRFWAFGSSPGGPVAVMERQQPKSVCSPPPAKTNRPIWEPPAMEPCSPFRTQGRNEGRDENRFRSLLFPVLRKLRKFPGAIGSQACLIPRRLNLSTFSHRSSRQRGQSRAAWILRRASGALRLRIFLPQQFLTEVDGPSRDFLANR